MGTASEAAGGPAPGTGLVAIARYRVLAPHLNDGVPLAAAARAAEVPYRTAQRWLAAYRTGGLTALERPQRADKGRRRTPDDLVAFIEGLAAQSPRPTMAALHRQAVSAATQRGWPRPGYGTVYRIVTALDPDPWVSGRHQAQSPNEIWRAGHARLDIWLLDDKGKPRRPWLTVIEDDHSRAVAGYAISLEIPSARSTALAFRQAIRLKPEPDWHVCGIPTVFHLDHGADSTSADLEQVMASLGVHLVYPKKGQPHRQGNTSRLIDAVTAACLPHLPGHAPSGNPDHAGSARLTLPELDAEIGRFIRTVYNTRPHSETGQAPQASWESGAFIPRMPDNPEQLDLLLPPAATPRKIHTDGIHFLNRRYTDPVLAGHVTKATTIRYDPRDLTEIRVYLRTLDGAVFLCRANCPELSERRSGLKEPRTRTSPRPQIADDRAATAPSPCGPDQTATTPPSSSPEVAASKSAAPASQWPLAARGAELEAAQAAWRTGHCQGVVVCGAAGVGKTRLAEELLERVTSKGVRTGRAAASAAAAGLPLGAVAHLIPPGADLSDPVRGFAQVARALAGPNGDRRWVWLLDDVHLLDAASAVLVRQLMDAGIVRLIATLRTGEPLNDATDALQAGQSVGRIDLEAFSPEQVGAVLQAALGGPVTRRTAHQLAQMSAGNALYLRELVLGALGKASLAFDGEIWQLAEDQALPATVQLSRLIEARLAGVDPGGRDALDLLAWCEPVSLADAEAAARDSRTLTRLEASGLVHARADQHRIIVSLAHPLYGEALRQGMPLLRRRTVLLEQVGRVRARGARRREDAVRITAWELAATGTADPAQLIGAAALAGYAHDYAQVLSLLDALPVHAHTTATRLMQGEAHYELGHWEECEAVLRIADPRTDQDVLTVTLARSENLFWSAGREREALDLNHAAHRTVSSEAAHRTLRHGEAAMEIARGRPHHGLALLEDMGHDVGRAPDVMTWFLAATLKPIGLEMVGRTDDALNFAQNAYASHAAFDDRGVFPPPAFQLLGVSWALASNGQLAKAREVGEQAFAELSAARLPVPRNWMALYLGRLEWHAGHPVTARRWFAEGCAVGRTAHRISVRPALEGIAACAALLGDTDAAEQALAEARTVPQSRAFVDLTHLAPAWLAAAHGDLPRARTVLAEGAAVARTVGLAAIETVLLTDLARLGDPGGAVSRLAELARACDGAFAPTRADLAAALATSDPDQLAAAAQACAAIGADLLAAEAATAAASAHRAAGHVRKATAAYQQARAHAARCEGARTPLLAIASTVARLTARERDIALLAAHGTSAKDIAGTLHLSVRTVESHLQHAYTKLGITTRRELTQALTP